MPGRAAAVYSGVKHGRARAARQSANISDRYWLDRMADRCSSPSMPSRPASEETRQSEAKSTAGRTEREHSHVEERRQDPEDGKWRTFSELSDACQAYSKQDVLDYWNKSMTKDPN